MRSIVCLSVVIAMVIGAMAMSGASQTQPPRTNDEWQQNSQSNNFNSGSSGSIGSAGAGSPPPEFVRMREEMQQRMAEQRQRMEQMQKQAEEERNRAMQQLVGADDAQWKRLKPIMEKIEHLKGQMNACIEMGSSSGNSNFTFKRGQVSGAQWSAGFSGSAGGGGFGSSSGPGQARTWQPSRNSSMSQGQDGEVDHICQELLTLLQAPNTPAPQISQKVMALRQAKERARTELIQQQNRLRKQINPQQEPALIVMGYLD